AARRAGRKHAGLRREVEDDAARLVAQRRLAGTGRGTGARGAIRRRSRSRTRARTPPRRRTLHLLGGDRLALLAQQADAVLLDLAVERRLTELEALRGLRDVPAADA